MTYINICHWVLLLKRNIIALEIWHIERNASSSASTSLLQSVLYYKKKNPVELEHCETSSSYWVFYLMRLKPQKEKGIFYYEIWLRHMKTKNRKMLKVLKLRQNHSQSSVFGLAVLYPTRSEISRFSYIETRRRKIAIECCLYCTYHYIL